MDYFIEMYNPAVLILYFRIPIIAYKGAFNSDPVVKVDERLRWWERKVLRRIYGEIDVAGL